MYHFCSNLHAYHKGQRKIRVESAELGAYTGAMNGYDLSEQSRDYERVADAIAWIEAHFKEQPSLDEIAASVHLSRHHFQRLFKRWAGISPTQFMHYLTVEYARKQLDQAQPVLDAALDAGLSGSGRLHDLFVHFVAMTPGEYKKAGKGLLVRYGFHQTPFGEALIARTERGICGLHFVIDGDRDAALALLTRDWRLATVMRDDGVTEPLSEQLFGGSVSAETPIHLHVKGTNFQISVWRALLRIPRGNMVTYQDIASTIGKPTAYRAAATAIASNHIGFLIPCHRVINKIGRSSNYRWGSTRKRAMLGWEAAHNAAHDAAHNAAHNAPLPV